MSQRHLKRKTAAPCLQHKARGVVIVERYRRRQMGSQLAYMSACMVSISRLAMPHGAPKDDYCGPCKMLKNIATPSEAAFDRQKAMTKLLV